MHICNQINRDVIERSTKNNQNKSKYTIAIDVQASMQNNRIGKKIARKDER